MRLFSLLPMILAAILLAGSVSAHHTCDRGHSLGKKVYQVCKSWRVDQGGPMPTDLKQHCRNLLCEFSEDNNYGIGCNGLDSDCVNDDAREKAKNELGYW